MNKVEIKIEMASKPKPAKQVVETPAQIPNEQHHQVEYNFDHNYGEHNPGGQLNDANSLKDWEAFSQQISQQDPGKDREVKDALVQKEILDQGHAPQDFEHYLQKFKGRQMI